jgi:DUF917 family protein
MIDNIDAVLQEAVFVLNGVEALRSDFALAACGPRYFEIDIDYMPVEELRQDSNMREC